MEGSGWLGSSTRLQQKGDCVSVREEDDGTAISPGRAYRTGTQETYSPGRHTSTRRSVYISVRDTWIESTVWTPQEWSAFMRAHRTNNDVEGWHRRINLICKDHAAPLYLLIEHLYDEVRLMKTQMAMLSQGKLKRRQRQVYRQLQHRIFSAWDKYNDKTISTNELLKTISHLTQPVTE